MKLLYEQKLSSLEFSQFPTTQPVYATNMLVKLFPSSTTISFLNNIKI